MKCEHDSTEILRNIYEHNGESLKILYCNDCCNIFKYRYQFDSGCGSDCFIIYPGDKERGVEFSFKEFLEVLEENIEKIKEKHKWLYVSEMKIIDVEKAVIKLNYMGYFLNKIYIMILKNFYEKVEK